MAGKPDAVDLLAAVRQLPPVVVPAAEVMVAVGLVMALAIIGGVVGTAIAEAIRKENGQ